MMIAGTKRAREDNDELTTEVSAAVRRMSNEVDDMIGSVGKVNSAVLDSAVQASTLLQHMLSASSTSNVQLWELLTQSQESRTATALSHIRTADDARRNALSVSVLQQQLTNSTVSAAEEVAKGLDTANSTAVTLFSSQLAGEQETNEKLVSHAQEFMRKSLDAIQSYSRRALNAELSLTKKNLAVARLQSSLSFYQNAFLRHHSEILSLIKIVRLLAAKNKDADLANSELRQAKAHVRLLEKQLDLAGIVHAIVPPDFVPYCTPSPPPCEALKRNAPEYFALRLLEHKDMTLSELVDSWQKQESRIMVAEEKCRDLEKSAETLRREALVVHQGFLEEKRRREVVEHRLVDIVRERINPSGNDALLRQLTQLRSDYTKVLDDSAQIATSLSLTREILAREQKRNAMLEAKMQEMKDDAEVDEVANTLSSLRRYYEEELERLRNTVVDAETQSALAVTHAEEQQELAVSAYNALKLTEQTVTDISAALSRTEEQILTEQQRIGVSHINSIAQDGLEAIAQSEAHLKKAMSSFQKVMSETETKREKDLATFGEQITQLVASFKTLQPIASHNSEDTTGTNTMVSKQQQQEIRTMMREALTWALQFVSDELETGEASKTALLDTSISDARNVRLLFEKVRELTEERDAALDRLARCERLIDQHSLTAIERVLMHEVSVEDSLDAIEATEQIATLRDKVSSLETIRSAALAEVEGLRAELQRDCELNEHSEVRLKLLERQNSRLVTSLQESLTREVTLIQQVRQLQQNLKRWAPCSEMEVEGREGTPETTPLTESTKTATVVVEDLKPEEQQQEMAKRLEELCSSILEMKQQLVQMQVTTSTKSTPGDEQEETQLLRHGVRHVADALRETLRRAELFRHALPVNTTTLTGTEAPLGETTESENTTDEVAEVRHRLETSVNALAADVTARDGELSRLRGELDAREQREEALKKAQEDLVQQNAELQRKAARLVHINKQLVEELKAARNTGEASPT
ncbi:uncharacterized protein TM35_000054460 [Trypanosoma theileri]|uniref:Uncharacterized protein n=1 Tax=Trypanosoma theileri TaxID=67003 RepID=A0A1X0P5Z0_9TRYP|nr:uncharacterized protein TM35_000054460 [Trypanosoma theileri]ORC91850.1 hypothetical protein TM35_000054460 [Trypanosoma theileri]